MSKGKFYGVGVGPGDPELLTLKARRILENCPVIAAPQTKDRRMLALDIVKGVLDISQKVVLPLKFLMTTDEAALAASHQREAAHVRVLLEEALDVAMINCGDISIYSTFSYLEAIISQAGYDTEAVPGVPSFCAVAAALGTSLTTMQKPLHIIPAGYGNFADHLELEGTKVLMKAGSKLPGVKDTLRKKGLLAKAAAQLLFSGRRPAEVGIVTPRGIPVRVPVAEAVLTGDEACCAVQKDAGDDPDVTDGVLVYAKVRKTSQPGILLKGGRGIGRVERPGLDQPVGAAAINRVPRQMIRQEVQAVCAHFDRRGGAEVMISIPQGAELARRTFNARLGIAGGISVLGTSGIVEPQSTQALLDCIALELRTLAAGGYQGVILTPGNYGEAFIAADTQLAAAKVPTVRCSNYIGAALDFAVAGGFNRILLVGHLGKFIKLAGGIMNTHSKTADCRMELFAAHAALAGAGREVVARLMQATATEACIPILEAGGLKAAVFCSLLQNIQAHLRHRAGPGVMSGAVLFSNEHGLLGQTETAAGLIASFQQAAYQ